MTTAERLRQEASVTLEGNDDAFKAIAQMLQALMAQAADELEALTKERDDLRATLSAAYSALRSYQYGNSSPELAEKIADAIEAALKGETK